MVACKWLEKSLRNLNIRFGISDQHEQLWKIKNANPPKTQPHSEPAEGTMMKLSRFWKYSDEGLPRATSEEEVDFWMFKLNIQMNTQNPDN